MHTSPSIICIDHPAAPARAADAVAAGGTIAFPTDTVYGLGVDPTQPDAIEHLYVVKGRSPEKALPILLASPEQWQLVATNASDSALQLMKYFWPGALTIILERRLHLPNTLGASTGTIAVRVPAHDHLRRILECTGPLASSSANRSGEVSLTNATAIANELDGLSVIFDGGPSIGGEPSTIVDTTGAAPVILRQGGVLAASIFRVLAES